jgi:preprotein translocase subunit SecE
MATQRTTTGQPGIVRAARRLPAGFLGEIFAELKKVVWPTREEATRLTIMVLTVSVVVGVALGLIDVGFSELVRKLI